MHRKMNQASLSELKILNSFAELDSLLQENGGSPLCVAGITSVDSVAPYLGNRSDEIGVVRFPGNHSVMIVGAAMMTEPSSSQYPWRLCTRLGEGFVRYIPLDRFQTFIVFPESQCGATAEEICDYYSTTRQ